MDILKDYIVHSVIPLSIAVVIAILTGLLGILLTTVTKGEQVTGRINDIRVEMASNYVKKTELKDMKSEIIVAMNQMENRLTKRIEAIK